MAKKHAAAREPAGIRWGEAADEPAFRLQIGGSRARSPRHSGVDETSSNAFTLVELLVVISIIGLLLTVGLPALRDFGKSNATISATRQLLDDIAFGRARAISGRMNVYMVFIPPGITNMDFTTPPLPQNELALVTNLYGGQYTTYAFFATRNIGDQPGRSNPRYLTSWKTLPQGTFIAPVKFTMSVQPYENMWQFQSMNFPFPLATSARQFTLPYLGFDSQGRLMSQRDEVIPLARGSVFPARGADNLFIAAPADVVESPFGNWSITNTMWNHVYIDWLTGRARVERQQIQ